MPASSVGLVHQKACQQQGHEKQQSSGKNACRDAHRFVKRWGLAWRVPFSFANIANVEDPSPIMAPYLSPKSWVQFLLQRQPELVMGGHSGARGQENLKAFWESYRQIHPEHDMFSLPGGDSSARWSTTLAMSLHGDEGRGKKKAQTFILMLETNLGLETLPMSERSPKESCPSSKRCRGCDVPGQDPDVSLAAQQRTNLRGNSYLTKFVICAFPAKLYRCSDHDEDFGEEPLNNFMNLIYGELRDLALNGVDVNGQTWFIQLTGMKGDLDFYRKSASLRRCWKKQLGANLMMCHECAAGDSTAPFEDCTAGAAWRSTLFFQRPWPEDAQTTPKGLVFEHLRPERILRRDLFHNSKTGVFRDYIGGTITLLMWMGYFHLDGEGNGRPTLFKRAHMHFKLWCCAMSEAPGLRSFSEGFFNLSSWSSYAWVNCKGSDSMLLLRWLQTQLFAFMREPLHADDVDTLRLMREGCQYAIVFMHNLYNHGLWLTPGCARQVASGMRRFIKVFNCLAHLARTRHNYTAYPKKSKLHMLTHTVHDLEMWLSNPAIKRIPNVLIWSCEMNEDIVGRLSRLSRRCAAKQGARRTLELYLIKCKSVSRRFRTSTRRAR